MLIHLYLIIVWNVSEVSYLEHCDESLRKVIKVAPANPVVREVELASEYLHPQQGEDDDEEEEEQQQGGDRGNGVEQGCHQVTKTCPVPEARIYSYTVQ